MPMMDKGRLLGDRVPLFCVPPTPLCFRIICFSNESNIYTPRCHFIRTYFDGSLLVDQVHLFAHNVLAAQGRLCKVLGLLIMGKCVLELLEVLMLDGDVMQGNYHHGEAIVIVGRLSLLVA
jgi:hypothetical protein